MVGSTVIIVVVAIIEDIECVILFIAGQYLVRIEFVAYGEVVSGVTAELIFVVISQEPVGIAVFASAVVIGRGTREVDVTRQAMVRIVVVVGSAIGGIRGIRGVLW